MHKAGAHTTAPITPAQWLIVQRLEPALMQCLMKHAQLGGGPGVFWAQRTKSGDLRVLSDNEFAPAEQSVACATVRIEAQLLLTDLSTKSDLMDLSGKLAVQVSKDFDF